jgi:hypothetical protein
LRLSAATLYIGTLLTNLGVVSNSNPVSRYKKSNRLVHSNASMVGFGQNKPDPSLRRTAAKGSPLGHLDLGAARITAKGSEESESGDDLMVDDGSEGIVTMPMYHL